MNDTTDYSIKDLYLESVASFIAFCHVVDDEDWSRPVPCTPAWTVRDVVSHVAGVADDVVNARTDGIATDAWTASQVERNARFELDELLARWESQAEQVADAIADAGQVAAAFDCHEHEHDLRHALDLPGDRDTEVVRVAARGLAEGLGVDFPTSVEVDGVVLTNAHEADGREPHREVVLRAMTGFEVFRSRFGRRCRSQVERYAWSGPPERIAITIDNWFIFGPSMTEIHD